MTLGLHKFIFGCWGIESSRKKNAFNDFVNFTPVRTRNTCRMLTWTKIRHHEFVACQKNPCQILFKAYLWRPGISCIGRNNRFSSWSSNSSWQSNRKFIRIPPESRWRWGRIYSSIKRKSFQFINDRIYSSKYFVLCWFLYFRLSSVRLK